MKKYNYLMFGIALGAGILGKAVCASAYTSCVGGTEITTNVYGTEGASDYCTPVTCPAPAKKFCLSLRGMNWWSAFTWCIANGGELPSVEDLCPTAKIAAGEEGTCPAMIVRTGNLNVLTSSIDSGGVYGVGLNNGRIYRGGKTPAHWMAICK